MPFSREIKVQERNGKERQRRVKTKNNFVSFLWWDEGTEKMSQERQNMLAYRIQLS